MLYHSLSATSTYANGIIQQPHHHHDDHHQRHHYHLQYHHHKYGSTLGQGISIGAEVKLPVLGDLECVVEAVMDELVVVPQNSLWRETTGRGRGGGEEEEEEEEWQKRTVGR